MGICDPKVFFKLKFLGSGLTDKLSGITVNIPLEVCAKFQVKILKTVHFINKKPANPTNVHFYLAVANFRQQKFF